MSAIWHWLLCRFDRHDDFEFGAGGWYSAELDGPYRLWRCSWCGRLSA